MRVEAPAHTSEFAALSSAKAYSSSASSTSGPPPRFDHTRPRPSLLLTAGISLLSFGVGLLIARRESDVAVSDASAPLSQYGGPDELKAAIDTLKHAFGDRPGLVSTDASDTDTHATWFTGRKPSQCISRYIRALLIPS